MAWEGKRSIVTYYQDDEPTSPNAGELWYCTNNKFTYVYDGSDWKIVRGSSFAVGSYGYTFGGGIASYIGRMTFASDSGMVDLVGQMSTDLSYGAAANSSVHGFIMGGTGVSNFYSTIDRFTFPFLFGESVQVGNLSQTRDTNTGCNSSSHGYSMGGFYNIPPAYAYSIIDRITFPFDSGTASHVGNTSQTKYGHACANSSLQGYAMGGFGAFSSYLTEIDRLVFPFDSGTASHTSNLAGASYGGAGCNSSIHGFCMGGAAGSPPYYSYIQRLTFPHDSGTASTVGNLTASIQYAASLNSSIHGYSIAGTAGPVNFSTIDRITFPFDSGTATAIGYMYTSTNGCMGLDETDFITQFV